MEIKLLKYIFYEIPTMLIKTKSRGSMKRILTFISELPYKLFKQILHINYCINIKRFMNFSQSMIQVYPFLSVMKCNGICQII